VQVIHLAPGFERELGKVAKKEGHGAQRPNEPIAMGFGRCSFLIVNAEDFGMCHVVNEAILRVRYHTLGLSSLAGCLAGKLTS
jgi:hypothetical protein